MRVVFGWILLVIGWGCAAWFGMVGGSFSVVYLLGYLGTGGREAGGELALALAATLAGIGIGLLLVKLGSWLAKNEATFAA